MSTANLFFPKERNGREHVRAVDVELLCQELESHRRVLIVDVRSKAEFHGPRGHITGATSIPVHQLLARWREIEPHKHDLVVIVSERGLSSRLAALELEFAGFEDVCTLEGGMQKWWDHGYPVTIDRHGQHHRGWH